MKYFISTVFIFILSTQSALALNDFGTNNKKILPRKKPTIAKIKSRYEVWQKHDDFFKKAAREAEGDRPAYSINLMWINKRLNLDQKYLHSAETEAKLKEELLNRLFSWAEQNPESVVNLWYDGVLTSEEAIKNTQVYVDHYNQTKLSSRIVLRDVRSLPEVQANPEAFSSDLPVFFRVDLLRAIAAINQAQKGQIFVYSDLDVPPMHKESIFDHDTKVNLDKYGLSMASVGIDSFENSFQIISDKNPNMMKAMKEFLIGLNIARAKYAVANKNGPDSFKCYSCYGALVPSEMVYQTYRPMMKYFHALEGHGTLLFGRKPYDDADAEAKKTLISKYVGAYTLNLFLFKLAPQLKEQYQKAQKEENELDSDWNVAVAHPDVLKFNNIINGLPPGTKRNIPTEAGDWDLRSMSE